MKKAFTLVELIFVIVVLGVLAAIAVPRLAGTRADAEITSTLANIRTLLSDAGSYYSAKGGFVNQEDGNKISWSVFTDVSLHNQQGSTVGLDDKVDRPAILKVGGKNCIEVSINGGGARIPTYVAFKSVGNTSLCNAVVNSKEVQQYINNQIVDLDGGVVELANDATGAMAISSSVSIFAYNDLNASNTGGSTGGNTTNTGTSSGNTGNTGVDLGGNTGTDTNTGTGGSTDNTNTGGTTGGNTGASGNTGSSTGGNTDTNTGTGGSTDNTNTGGTTGGNTTTDSSGSTSGGGVSTTDPEPEPEPTVTETPEQLKNRLETQYGISIQHSTDYADWNDSRAEGYLKQLETELAKYDTDLFRKLINARGDTIPVTIIVTEKIKVDANIEGTVVAGLTSTWTYVYDGAVSKIDLELTNVQNLFASTLHHEMMHVLDSVLEVTLGGANGKFATDITRYNPAGFQYSTSTINSNLTYSANSDPNNQYFASWYAKTDLWEDRAELFNWLMYPDTQPVNLFVKGTPLYNKAVALIAQLRTLGIGEGQHWDRFIQ